MRSIPFFAFVLPLAALACSSNESQPSALSKTIGPEGGTIDVALEDDDVLGGTELVIPPGALAKATKITISRGSEIVGNGESSRGPSVRLSPDGTMLALPATLRVPQSVALADDPGTLYFAVLSGGTHSELPVTGSDGKGSRGNITHFSEYELVSVASGGSECEAAAAHPPSFDPNANYFCYKNYVCRVCRDNNYCGGLDLTDAYGDCGGAFPQEGDCLGSEWNDPNAPPPVLPGCVKERPADLSTSDQIMCCANASPPAPSAPPFEPHDVCQNVCAAQGASAIDITVDCSSTVEGGPSCSGNATFRWSGRDTTTCGWYLWGGLVASGLKDSTGSGSDATLGLAGFPVGSQPALPVSLGQGQTCPNKDPQIGVTMEVQEAPPVSVNLTCTDPAGGGMKTPIGIDLTACHATLCTECQTRTKDFFVSSLGGSLYGELTIDPGVETMTGDAYPAVKCVVSGSFGFGGCMGGLCKSP